MRATAWIGASLLTVVVWAGILLSVLSDPADSSAGFQITPTPTTCPVPTQEIFLVDPVTSPTGLLTQTVNVYLGNGEATTITAESGVFAYQGDFGAYDAAEVEIALLPDTTHHLVVTGKVKLVESNGCQYGGYTLSTTFDRNGEPLLIEQQLPGDSTLYLPIVPVQ